MCGCACVCSRACACMPMCVFWLVSRSCLSQEEIGKRWNTLDRCHGAQRGSNNMQGSRGPRLFLSRLTEMGRSSKRMQIGPGVLHSNSF